MNKEHVQGALGDMSSDLNVILPDSSMIYDLVDNIEHGYIHLDYSSFTYHDSYLERRVRKNQGTPLAMSVVGARDPVKSHSADFFALRENYVPTKDHRIWDVLVADGVSDPRGLNRTELDSRLEKLISNIREFNVDVIPGVILKVLEPYWNEKELRIDGLKRFFPEKDVYEYAKDIHFFEKLSIDEVKRRFYRKSAILRLAYGIYESNAKEENTPLPGFTGTEIGIVDRGYSCSLSSLSLSDSPLFLVNKNAQIFQSFASPNSVYDKETVRQMRIIMQEKKVGPDEARILLIESGYFNYSYLKINDPNSGVTVSNGSRKFWASLINNIGMNIDECSPIVAVVAASDGLLSPFTRFDSPNDRDGLMRMIELMLSGQIQQVIPAVRKEALRTRLMEGKLQREKMHDDILVCFLDMVGKAGLEEVLKKGLSWGMF